MEIDSNRRLIVASTNAGKIREVQLALHDLQDWNIEPLPPGLPEIEESGTTFIENATLKATQYSRLVHGIALADDSGLCVKALDGRPGVYSARYGSIVEALNQRVLAELAALQDPKPANRDAAFHCAFVVARSGTVIWSTESKLGGEIAFEPAGDSGFGFDPIFFVPKMRKTLAQMTAEEKNLVSPRGQALLELRRFLISQ